MLNYSVAELRVKKKLQNVDVYKRQVPEQQKVAQDFAEFSLTLVLRKEDKQNSNMTWQRYKLNLRNSLLLGEFFLLWRILMLF